MIVNKCDNCNLSYEEGLYPGWIQITGDRGVLIVGTKRNVMKYQVLDFCCAECAKEFLNDVIKAMNTPPGEEI